MNTRERLIAILGGEKPDRMLWIPRIELWYKARSLAGTLPEELCECSLREVELKLFGATPARGGRIFEKSYDGVEVVATELRDRIITEYHTPRGSVRTVSRISDELLLLGLPGRVEEDLLKGPGDYAVWEYVVEHTQWTARYDDYAEYDAEIGPWGLPMVSVGDVPFHEFVQTLAGYGDAFYQIADYPAEVEHLLNVMMEVQKERMWPVVLNSPANLLLWGVHLSSQFTPPSFFERYITPYCKEFFPLLHDAGKKVAMHADNDTSGIAELLEEAGWDMLECFVTAPMVPLTLEKARQIWGTRMILWGGIPSTILSPSYPEDRFRQHIDDLFRTVGNREAFILGVADNIMPDSEIERVRWITERVASLG
jgi:hypothetical protein